MEEIRSKETSRTLHQKSVSYDTNPNEAFQSIKVNKTQNELQQESDASSRQYKKSRDKNGLQLPTIKAYLPNTQRQSQHRMRDGRSKSTKGMEVFGVMNLKKQTDFQVQQMENRLKKLEDEELKAVKKIQQTIERTKQFEKIRQEKELDKKQWSDYQSFKSRKTQEQKHKIIVDKEEQYKRMTDQQKLDYLNKRHQNQVQRKHFLEDLEETHKQLDQEYYQKKEKGEMMKQRWEQGLSYRREQQEKKERLLAIQYERKQKEAQRVIEENKRMVEEMARKEQELLQKLQVTQKLKQDVELNFKKKIASQDKPQQPKQITKEEDDDISQS